VILGHYILWRLGGAQGPVALGYVLVMVAIMWAVIEVVDRTSKAIKRKDPMSVDIEKLKHTVTRKLIEALQKGDVASWNSLFAKNAQLFDDGSPRDLHHFTEDALGHERFTSIDKVENNGLDITGHFHTESWGDFVSYFRITLNDQDKIVRLDIGQA
jgi:hypothetical protein